MPLSFDRERALRTAAPTLRVCGVDEAGRGPLAGPVVAAAVVLWTPVDGLNDSKVLSQARREQLLNVIYANGDVAVALAEPAEIDRLNILGATLTAMWRAVLAVRADHALIDGNRLPDALPCPAEAIVKGDARIASIAAASIVAKTVRDALMVEADARFPGYGFAQHKGYPTAAHRAALLKFGPCAMHRRSFRPVTHALAQKPPTPPRTHRRRGADRA